MAITIEVYGPPGMTTPTIKLVDSSDVVQETITLTEKTNAKGLYTGTVTAGAATYTGVFYSGASALGVFEAVVVTSTDPSTVVVRDKVDPSLHADWLDGGRLDLILDTAAASSGTGTYSCTWTVTDGTDPIENATISIYLSGVLKGTSTTNVSGQVSMSLDAATYTVAISADGHQYTPTTHEVSATEATWTETFAMTAISITASDPDTVTVYTVCRNTSGVQADIVVTLEVVQAPDNGHALDSDALTDTSSAQGVAEFTGILPGTTVRYRRGTGAWQTDTVPSDQTTSYELRSITGP